jgi:hypothetical protein
MAHSLEVLLDPAAESAIRAQWQALEDAGLPSQVRVQSPTNRPHVTLIAAQRISPEVDEVMRGLADRFPVDCVVGAPLVFGGSGHTLARLIVPSAQLLALHAEVYRRCLPYLTGDPSAHCRPGHWTAHVTLARRLTADQVGATMPVVNVVGADLAADVVGLRRWDSDQRRDHLLVG